MTNQTRQFVLTVAAFFASLGVIGVLCYKIGIVDVVLTVIINLALLFPIMLVVLGVLNPDTYNMLAQEAWSLMESIGKVFERAEVGAKTASTLEQGIQKLNQQADKIQKKINNS